MDELKNAKVEDTSEWKNLRKDIDATKAEIQSLTDKAREMRNAKVPTEEYVEIQNHLQNAEKEFDKLYAKQERMQALGQTSGKTWDSLQYSMDELGNAIKADRIDLQNLIAEGKAFQSQTGTDAYRQVKTDLQAAYEKARQLKGEEKELEAAFNSDKTAGLDQLSGELKETQGDVELTKLKMQQLTASSKTNILSKFASNAQKGFKKLGSALGGAISKMKKLHSGTKQTNKGFSNLLRTMKSMILSMAVFQVFSKGVEFMKSGLQNLAVYSQSYNKAMSDLVSSTGMLKNSLAVAFAPIISACIPYLVKLIDWISAAANAVSRFFAILSGKSTYTKAIKQNKDYAASLDKVGSSANEAKGSLAGFDDLDVLQKNDASSGGGNGSSSGADGSGFEEEAVGAVSDWAQSFKDAIDAGDWYGVGFLVAQKLNEALAAIDWGFVQDKAAYFATNLALALNGFVDGLNWNLLGSTIANGINTALIFAYTFLTTFGWSGAGTAMANLINGAFSTIDWGLIGDTIIAGLRGVCDMVIAFLAGLDIFSGFDFSGLQSSLDELWDSLIPFAGTVGDGLLWFLENVLIPLAGWTITEVLPVFLDLLSEALNFVTEAITIAQPYLQWLWENILTPIAEWTGGMIVEDLSGLADALGIISDKISGLNQFISEHKTGVELAVIAIAAFTAAIIANAVASNATSIAMGILSVALGVYNGVTAIASTATAAFNAVLGFLTSPITLVIAAIAALIAIGVLLYQNWDTICEKATEIWGAIKEFISNAITKVKETISNVMDAIKTTWNNIWTGIKTTVVNIWNGIKTSVTDKINAIKTGISNTLNTIKTTWNNIWTSLKTTVTNIFNGIWNTIKGVINSILGGIEGMANGVIKGINKVIQAMNRLSFDIPDWVPPPFGGKTFGFDIKELSEISIPRLANGGVTTGSVLANIGEAGREAVLPLENNTGWMDDLADKLAARMPSYGTPAQIIMELDGREFARGELPYFNAESSRIGVTLVTG